MDVGSDVGSDVGPPAPTLDEVAAEARACTLCAPVLPLGPRPILRVSPTARLLIASQAPGTKVHVSGTPWTDASGERLRRWLGLDLTAFHDPARVAILPTGLCYPGRLPRGGDHRRGQAGGRVQRRCGVAGICHRKVLRGSKASRIPSNTKTRRDSMIAKVKKAEKPSHGACRFCLA